MINFFLSNAVRGSVVLSLVLLGTATISAQTYRSPQLRQSDLSKAYEKLQHARRFNLGGAGFANEITDEEKAFRRIFESTAATTLLQRLIEDASPERKLYALFGLRLRAPELFQTAAERLRETPPERKDELFPIGKGKVRMIRGCIIFETDFEAAVAGISKGEWDSAFQSNSRRSLP